MDKNKIQNIVDYAFPKIQSNFGIPDIYKPIPKI